MISTTVTLREGIQTRRCLFTDTDSLTYQFQTDNVYKDFFDDEQLFDFSGYEKDSPFYDD